MSPRRGFGATWWGTAWVEALEGRARLDPNRLPRGRSYARSGAVLDLQVRPGEVLAPVQGRRAHPYQVRVRVREFTSPEWDRLLDAVAGQLGHLAALLDGELPAEVLDDVSAAGLDLLPGPGELQPRCSCPDWADPCKHSAAVCYLVADVLDADPFALLLLRGRERAEVLAGLRTRRGAALGGADGPAPAAAVVGARQAWERTGRPALPALPLPPERPGRPAPLAVDPPPGAGLDVAVLAALAADAAARALALARGDGDGGLGPDREADLARRAAALLDGPGLDGLASRAGVPGPALLAAALAWRHGGAAGVEVLAGSWQPTPAQLAAGRAALGPGARARANRLTRGGVQLRLGRDLRWYPYRRGAGARWDPAGPPDPDPAAALAPPRACPPGPRRGRLER